MFLKKNELDNISGYTFHKRLLFSCNKVNELYSENQLICKSIDGKSLKSTEDILFFSSVDENKTYVFQNDKLRSIDSAVWLNTIYENTIISYNYQANERVFSIQVFDYILNLPIKNIEIKLSLWNLIREKNYLYFWDYRKFIIKRFSLILSEINWETDLKGRTYLDVWQEEKEVTIQRIIGIYENQLLLTLNNDELISIDIETGKVLWETKDFIKNNLPNSRNISQFRFVYWHIEGSKMYQLDGNIYYSIDLYSQEIEILWKDESLENFLTITHKTYTTDYIYFTGSYNNQLQPHLIGVFNRKLLKVDWVHDMDLSIDPKMGYSPSLNQPPQVDENKLYVLDTGGTLHIFEKE